MTGVDTRCGARDSFFLLADILCEGQLSCVKVRNLSSGGMMAEGGCQVTRGQQLSVTLRNIGTIDGTVAWVEGNRFGVAFAQEIDPAHARRSHQGGEAPLVQRPAHLRLRPRETDTGPLRKI